MSRLERFTHICLITVAIASLALLVESRFGRGRQAGTPQASQDASPELLNKPLAVEGQPDWKAANLNVVLYVSARCRFCEASLPFYRRLAAERDRFKPKVALHVVALDQPEDIKDVFSRERIRAEGMYRIQRMPGLAGTPTLLLVDRTGVVRRVFKGQLDAIRERRVLDTISAVGKQD